MPRKPTKSACEVAEEMLVAAVLNVGSCETEVTLTAGHFEQSSMGSAFVSAVSILNAGATVSPEAVAVESSRLGLVPIDIPTLKQICESYPIIGTKDIDRLASEVLRYSELRRIEASCREAIADIRRGSVDPATVANSLQTAIVKSDASGKIPMDSALVAANVVNESIRKKKNPSAGGWPTGLVDLDKYIGNIVPGRQIVIAGRPGMGKTALASCIVAGVLKKDDLGAIMFSLEMTPDQMESRTISSAIGVPTSRIMSGELSDDEMAKLVGWAAKREPDKLYIESGVQNVAQMVSRVRWAKTRLAAKGRKLSLVVLDYVQLLAGYGNSREQAIAEISRATKLLALEMGICVILVAQLNRQVEMREGKVPMMSDLRESGSLEQDADQVLLCFREHYYNGNAPEDEAKVIIAKNRWGPTETVLLGWDGARTLFYNR
jgi:replicative DNA helicase